MRAKTTYLLGLAVLVGALTAPTAAPATVALQLEAPTLAQFDAAGSAAGRTKLLLTAPRIAETQWWGGAFSVGDGEHVTVYVSSAYPEAQAVAQKWADFFDGLPHGAELSLLTAYIAPLDEVGELCVSDQAIGCYWGQKLVTIGDSSAGIPPAAVAAHEYGHHIAGNRLNDPWPAIAWGTKRWASSAGICSRVQARTAFPGDEGANYSFNPGEAFAESYRVLVQTNGSALAYDWPIVDYSFRPDSQALASVREDVLHPWTTPTQKTIRGKFLRRSRTWSATVATPLDGELRLRVTAPGGGAHDVTLLSSDGRTVLATSSWDGSGGKSIEYRICGARSVKARVTRGGVAARFTLRVTTP
jgi:hypothetical protein